MLRVKRVREEPRPEFKLQPFNQQLQDGSCLAEADREVLWKRWLWEVDLEEKYNPDILYNEGHLLGILVCRDMMLHLGPDYYSRSAIGIEHIPTEFTLAPLCGFDKMSSKTLMSTMQVIQQGWVPTLYAKRDEEAPPEVWAATETLVRMCAHRLGFLLHFSSPSEELFDDAEATELLADGELGLTNASVRGSLDLLVVLFRHIDLQRRAVSPVPRSTEEIEREVMLPHAVEAAKDQFYKTAMHFDVWPGARLAYQHRFPGMYNCISQVAYYHDENYERRHHNKARDAIDVLPVLHHMHPELPIVFEEQLPPANTNVYWLLVSGRVYLMRRGTPVWCPNLFMLFLARNDTD